MVQNKKVQKQIKTTYFASFFKKRKTRRNRNHKGTLLSLEDQQTRNSFFREKRDCTKGTIQKKHCFFVKKGEPKRKMF